MTTQIKAYAATAPRASLEPFSYNPGELGPEEVEIKVTHCGICHSDLSMLDNEWGLSKYPFVPGHEAVGTIVALGESAKGLRIGQRVGVGWSAYSRLHCDECLTGDHNLCPESLRHVSLGPRSYSPTARLCCSAPVGSKKLIRVRRRSSIQFLPGFKRSPKGLV